VQDLLDSHADDALTQHQTHYFGPQTRPKQQVSAIKQQQSQKEAMQQQQQQQQQQQIQRGKHWQQELEQSRTTVHEKKLSRLNAGRQDASPKRIPASRPKIWMR
jgi:ATPase subunit of ABC transporter with duplicated ATPase domains